MRLRRFAAVAAVLALLGAHSVASAQTETFDSGAGIFTPGPNAWLVSQIHPAFPMTYTFPATDWGSGVRLQANTAGGALPAAVGFIYRTNVYRNFYVAVDMVAWAELDQALLLIAHGNNVNPPQDSSSYIINYDVLQDGEDPGDRRGGQFQLSVVSPGFATVQLGIAEFTLVPGGHYRFVLKGVESVEIPGTFDLTAQAYDHTDLTTPLITLVGQDFNYAEGQSGIGNYSRSGSDGTSDSTFDNYYAAATDPNLDIAPAIRHPIAGTAQVVTRIPAERHTNFHPPAAGISFTASTFTTDNINVSATRLYLNNVDVSASLSTPADAPTVSFTTPTSPLVANTVYTARIEVESATGLKGTNIFWFDTFSDDYLETPPVKTVEVEDYNQGGGQYLLDPIAVSGFDTNGLQINGFGVGYLDAVGLEGVDFHDNRTSIESDGGISFNQYRIGDVVGTVQGPFEIEDSLHTLQPGFYDDGSINRGNDNTRRKYAVEGMREYQVMRTETGEWLNYTRVFPDMNYHVYLRVGSFGTNSVNLDLVTSDPTMPEQTTSPLGTFVIPNQIMRSNYRYQQLMSDGQPAVVNLAGTSTIRLTIGGMPIKDNRTINLNYLLFVPVASTPPSGPTVFDNFNDGNDTANPAWDHFDPIGGLTAAPATFAFPTGGYRIVAPAPAAPDAGPARAGSFLSNAEYSDFYVAVDIIDFDDTVRQAFGIAARIRNAGLGTTDGYLFSWEPGSGTLPGTNNGDLDISVLVGESPVGQIETNSSNLHLERGKSYRFAFAGKGPDFVAEVYELPNTSEPLIRLYAHDPDNLYPSGQVGLITADQGSGELNPGDATFDNFLATTAEPRLTVKASSGNVVVSWPNIPFRLVSSPSLSSPVWTEVTTGITDAGDRKVHTTAASDTKYYRLVYP